MDSFPDEDRNLNAENIWIVYSHLLAKFLQSSVGDNDIAKALASVAATPEVGEDPADKIDLLPGVAPNLGNLAAIVGGKEFTGLKWRRP